MLLNEITPGSSIELNVLIGTQKLVFSGITKEIKLEDKRLQKELMRVTNGYPYLAIPAISKDDKIIGFPASGVEYQLFVVDAKDKKLYMWSSVAVKQITLPNQPPYHFFISNVSTREYNRRGRFRLWLGVSGTATIGLSQTTINVTIKDISATGIGFVVSNSLLEQGNVSITPQTHVVLSFNDDVTERNFRITCMVVRVTPSDDNRTTFGCRFAMENQQIAQFISDRQRERLREQRH